MLTLMETVDAASENLPVKEQQIYNTIHSIKQYLLWIHDSDEPGAEEAITILRNALDDYKESNPKWYDLSYTHASDYARKWQTAYTMLEEFRATLRAKLRVTLNEIL